MPSAPLRLPDQTSFSAPRVGLDTTPALRAICPLLPSPLIHTLHLLLRPILRLITVVDALSRPLALRPPKDLPSPITIQLTVFLVIRHVAAPLLLPLLMIVLGTRLPIVMRLPAFVLRDVSQLRRRRKRRGREPEPECIGRMSSVC